MDSLLDESCFDVAEMVAGITGWAAIESPSTCAVGVNRMMDAATATLSELGANVERFPVREGYGDVVSATLPGKIKSGSGILVLCHLDTVHPVGTLGGPLPLRREGDKLFGPGVYDMKGGTYMALYALRRLLEAGRRPNLPVQILCIPDEEIGSPGTRSLIEETARQVKYVLVPEPAQEEGRLITGRWAFARFRLRTRGKPAHAGARLSEGKSAIAEMARQIPRIEALSDPSRTVTLSVGVVNGGTFVNVVPLECHAEALAVLPSPDDMKRVCAAMLSLKPTQPDLEFVVEQGPIRPLFEPNAGSLSLYERASEIARQIGFDPGHGSAGGGSDANFTGAMGIPTLDGLGVCGGGFHTMEEHLLVSSLVPRARLFAGLLEHLA